MTFWFRRSTEMFQSRECAQWSKPNTAFAGLAIRLRSRHFGRPLETKQKRRGQHCRGGTPWPPLVAKRTPVEECCRATFVRSSIMSVINRGVSTECHPYNVDVKTAQRSTWKNSK